MSRMSNEALDAYLKLIDERLAEQVHNADQWRAERARIMFLKGERARAIKA